MERRLINILPTRRDVLKWGGLALAGTCVDRLVWPLKVQAAGKVTPRSTARNCIFIEMAGAISPMDCWDFKQTQYTPKDLDVKKIGSEVRLSKLKATAQSSEAVLSKTLFPQLIDQMHRVSLVRSMRAIGLLHFNGQYHTQAGRPISPVAREIPAWGSVVAYELDSQRRDSDTFPTYISTSVAKAIAGSIGSGFLPARFSAVDLDTTGVFDAFGGDSTGVNRVLEQRWNHLAALSELRESERSSIGSKAVDYRRYYQDAYRILNDQRWSKAFRATDEEKKRYGDDEYGLGLILARNLISADAGTRLVYVYDGDRWDQHKYIFDRYKDPKLNHYANCARFDKGFVSLLTDLASMPGKAPGKTLLDETLIVATSEFGRTPQMNPSLGRDHWRFAYTSLFAGGGVKGGRILGMTDDVGGYVLDTGWKHDEQPWMDNIVATIYSALGVDWTKRIDNTPSGRAYDYTQTAPLGGSEFISNDEIGELFA